MTDRTFYAHVADVPARSIDEAYSETNLPPLMTIKEIDAAIKAGVPAMRLEKTDKPHAHYFKPCPYEQIDVYRVLELFGVTDPVMQHIAKKALVSGGRGHKDQRRDVQDIADSANRKLAMLDEDRVLCGELK